MSAFTDSFYGAVPQTMSTRPSDNDDTYTGYDSQPFDDSFASGNDVFESQPRIYGEFSLEENGEFGGSESPILPPPSEMEAKEGFALREWRRQNAIQLEEKEKHDKELLSEIIKEADKYKVEFYKKREITCKNNKTNNREKEKLFIVNREKFHTEADKNYWKLIAELIPNEVRAIDKKKGKEDQVKKPSIAVIQGPKPGKPAELSRMRQIFLKLKHNSPSHLKHSSTPTAAPANEAKTSDIAVATTSLTAASLGTAPEPVAVA